MARIHTKHSDKLLFEHHKVGKKHAHVNIRTYTYISTYQQASLSQWGFSCASISRGGSGGTAAALLREGEEQVLDAC